MIENVDRSDMVDASCHLAELRAVTAGRQPAEAAAAGPQSPAATPTDAEETLDLVQAFVSDAASGQAVVAADRSFATPANAVGGANETSNVGGCAAKPCDHGPAAEGNIRVSVRVLDHLMNLAGELVLARNQLLQTVGTKSRDSLDQISASLNQVTSEIQEAVMQTRLQAVETVFGKFPRVVRDLCQTLGKQCELVVEGEDVELDKSIIEAIGDPLTHLIRNAVDHGLESPEKRVAAGKTPKGKILLKAFHQAGKVRLVVGDDGARHQRGQAQGKGGGKRDHHGRASP